MHMCCRLFCLGTFVAFIMKELNDTLIFAMWIGRLPEWKDTDIATCETLQTGFPQQRKAFTDARGVEYKLNHFPLGGISSWYRRVMYAVCFVKGSLELYTAFAGSGFILYSGTQIVAIERAMALTFVLELDDIMFRFLITDVHLRNMEHSIPQIELRRGDRGVAPPTDRARQQNHLPRKEEFVPGLQAVFPLLLAFTLLCFWLMTEALGHSTLALVIKAAGAVLVLVLAGDWASEHADDLAYLMGNLPSFLLVYGSTYLWWRIFVLVCVVLASWRYWCGTNYWWHAPSFLVFFALAIAGPLTEEGGWTHRGGGALLVAAAAAAAAAAFAG